MPTVNYIAQMRDRTHRSHDYSVPISVIDAGMTALLQSHPSDTETILLRASQQAQKVFFQSPDWFCVICMARATRIISTPVFHPKTGGPVILEYTPFPICYDPECNHAATRQANELTSGLSTAACDEEMKACKNCGAMEPAISHEMLCCAGCLAMWYCGRNCQIAHWKREHKRYCERLDK